MKLLFDENLSPRLPLLLATTFPESEHVREIGLKGRPDQEIWNYARLKNLVIISKDKDFYQRSLLFGSPPKFIWLCLGNCTREELLALIRRHEKDICHLRVFNGSGFDSDLASRRQFQDLCAHFLAGFEFHH